jgi:3-deoxy-D-manno-octulosonic-acid transferase
MALYVWQSMILFLLFLGSPLIAAYILTSAKHRHTFLKRLGAPSALPRMGSHLSAPTGSRPIWLHALSVGEVLSAVPLIKGLQSRWPHQKITVSVTTATGFAIARKVLPAQRVTLFYFPYDLLLPIHRVVKAVNPALVIIVETDLWPCFLWEMQRRRIPVIFVNARLSPRSYRNYRRLNRWVRPLLNSLSAVCVQSNADAQRFIRLGLKSSKIAATGNLKYDQLIDADPGKSTDNAPPLFSFLNHQLVWVAGSTHPGEETILLAVYAKIKQIYPQLLLIVAPRDPLRSQHIRQLALEQKLRVSSYTSVMSDKADLYGMEVLIIDTLGLLKQLYGLATIAFVGGSLVPCGGHNPIEPAVFACPVIFGPDMTDFKEVSQLIVAAEGALQVADEHTLFEAARMLLSDPNRRQQMGQNAYVTIQQNRGAVNRTMDVIAPFMLHEKCM